MNRPVSLLFLTILIFSNVSIGLGQNPQLLDFLKRHSIDVPESELIRNNRQYYNHDLQQGEPTWLVGTLYPEKVKKFDSVLFKLNVFDNHVYVKTNDQVFKLSNEVISGFDFASQMDSKHRFRKGFGLPYGVVVSAKSRKSVNDLLVAIGEREDFKELKINDIQFRRARETEISIALETGFQHQVTEVNTMLRKLGCFSLDTNYEIPELNEKTWVEVLYSDPELSLIKYHFKKVAQVGAPSLSQHKGVFMFDEQDYFIANRNGIIHEILFTKESIRQACDELGIELNSKLKKIGSETKLVRWLSSNRSF